MASELVEYKLTEDYENGFSTYEFSIGKNSFIFNVTSFENLSEYKRFSKLVDDISEEYIDTFFEGISEDLDIAGYDWEIVEQNEPVDVFKLMRVIEWIGKEYIIRMWPGVIIYEAENEKLHRIYKRMFPSVGYKFVNNLGSNYLYVRK